MVCQKSFHVENSGIHARRLGAELHGKNLLVVNDAAEGKCTDHVQC